MIELRQDPQGARRTAKGISVGKEKFKFKNDLTSLDDKLRIANKVNDKYLQLEREKTETLNLMSEEVGPGVEEILLNPPNKDGKGKIMNISVKKFNN